MEAAGEFCIADHLVFPDDWQVTVSQPGGPRIQKQKMEVAPDPMGENEWGFPEDNQLIVHGYMGYMWFFQPIYNWFFGAHLVPCCDPKCSSFSSKNAQWSSSVHKHSPNGLYLRNWEGL